MHACGLEGDITYTGTDFARYHPKKQGTFAHNGQVIGMVAQLHPTVLEFLKIETNAQVVVMELALESVSTLLQSQGYSFQSDAAYQTIQDQILTRDLCFVVDTDS